MTTKTDDAPLKTGALMTAPLAMLELSGDNVRWKSGEDPALPALVASIRALGVLAPLTVVPALTPAGKVRKGRYAVIAGGRRYRALRQLADELAIGENYAVPVIVRPSASLGTGGTTEISLAENVVRSALKPHEEFAAFARMRREGLDEAAIAAHFGVPPARVAQLLRLGNLAEPVFAAFAAGEMKLSEAQAYAGTADTALQEKVFAAMAKRLAYERGDWAIRAMIRGDARPTLDRLRAVGLDAYLAAGGRFDADLFGADECEGRVLDPDILDRLHLERQDAALAELKARMPQVEFVEQVHWGDGEAIDGEPEPLEGEAAAAAARIEAAIAEKRKALDALCDEDGHLIDPDDEEKASALDEAIGDLEEELADLRAQAAVTFAQVEGKIVAEAVFDPDSARYEARMIRHVPKTWAADAPVQFDTPKEEKAQRKPGLDPAASGPAFVKAEYGLSQESIELLSAQRLMILQALMMREARGPLRASTADFLPFAVIRSVEGGDPAHALGLEGRIASDNYATDTLEITGQPGFAFVDAQLKPLDRAWLIDPDPAKAFGLYCDRPADERATWSAYAATLILSRSLNAPGYARPVHDAIAAEVTSDAKTIREMWTPDAAFWARIPKKHQLAILGSIDEKLAETSKKLGREELTERCAAIFSGDQGLLIKLLPQDRAARAVKAALEWAPDYLSFASPEEEGPADQDARDGGADEGEAASAARAA